MEGKGERGRPRQKLMDWMTSQVHSKLKEAQHRETWSHWSSGPARGQRTLGKRKEEISRIQKNIDRFEIMVCFVRDRIYQS